MSWVRRKQAGTAYYLYSMRTRFLGALTKLSWLLCLQRIFNRISSVHKSLLVECKPSFFPRNCTQEDGRFPNILIYSTSSFRYVGIIDPSPNGFLGLPLHLWSQMNMKTSRLPTVLGTREVPLKVTCSLTRAHPNSEYNYSTIGWNHVCFCRWKLSNAHDSRWVNLRILSSEALTRQRLASSCKWFFTKLVPNRGRGLVDD